MRNQESSVHSAKQIHRGVELPLVYRPEIANRYQYRSDRRGGFFSSFKSTLRRIGFSLFLSRPFTRIFDRLQPLEHLGDKGERVAERFLLKKGWVVVARGYEDTVGELDIIAVDDQTLVFVEVKTRTSYRKGHPAEAVDLAKQKQISRVALNYLKWHRLRDVKTRFDIVAITWPDDSEPKVEHYVSAFEPTNDW